MKHQKNYLKPNFEKMPSDPGRPFTQQPSKSHCFVFTFPKKYWERKDEIISGQKLPREEDAGYGSF